MTQRSTAEILRDLGACPACGAPLAGDASLTCTGCAATFSVNARGQLDLRLQAAKAVDVALTIGAAPRAPRVTDAIPVGDGPYDGPVPRHLPRELARWIPRAGVERAVAVDVGCGAAANRPVLESLGFTYVGADIGDDAAPILADAHALPLRDGSADFAISLAVLEHVDHPVLVAREVARVLKPGARFIGTVAFLEPYHSQSKLHHSHLGAQRVLEAGGLDVAWIAPMPRWSVVEAQLSNALFPGLPKGAARRIGGVVDVAREAWFGMQRLRGRTLAGTLRRAAVSGAFAFCAHRRTNA